MTLYKIKRQMYKIKRYIINKISITLVSVTSDELFRLKEENRRLKRTIKELDIKIQILEMNEVLNRRK